MRIRQRIFTAIAHFACRRAKAIVAVAILLTVAAGAYAALTLRLNSNLDEMVSMRLDYHRRYIDFLKEFGDEEYLYVVVDAEKEMPRAKEFVQVLAKRLEQVPGLKEVIWRIDNPALEKNFLLYLTPEQLAALRAMLTQGPFAVNNIASWNGLAPLFGALATRISGPVSTSDEAELSEGFLFIDGLIDDMGAAMEGEVPFRSRLQELFFGEGETFDADGFYRNGDLLFVLIMPEKDYGTMEVIGSSLDRIREAIAQTRAEFPGIDAGLTGRPVLSADEIETSSRDMNLATVLALLCVGTIFILFFRGVARPMLAMGALVMGISWTFGFAAIAVGTLNVLSSVFALLLIGASIEYSVYIVARYEEELAHTGHVREAITRTLTTTGMANVTSALTTAAAFLCLTWTDFVALAQLGMIAAAGIVFCLTAMIVVLPAMLSLRDRGRGAEALKQVRSFSIPAMTKLYKKPIVLVIASGVLTLALLPFIGRVSFDNNLLNLQARGLDSVKYEHLIIEKSGETTWFARAVADTVGESHRLAKAFAALPSVRRVDDVERILPEGQAEKSKLVEAMAPAFEGLAFTSVGAEPNERPLMFELGRLASGLERLQGQAFQSGRADAVEELDKFTSKIRKLVDRIGAATPEQLKRLGEFQRAFFGDLQQNLQILATGMHPGQIALADLPANIVQRFVSPQGRYALFIYPKENIWDPAALERFITEIRGVDPGVIGTPIEVHESGRLMRETFARSAGLAFIVICLLVWLDFKTLRASAIAVLPLGFGMLWLVGGMGLAGLQFNMANFFAIPILIGTGVDFGVQVVHRLRQERGYGALGTSTGKGLLMTAMANGIGFGAMMIAHHRGLASLGAILAMGCLCCLIAAVVLTPPVAQWLSWGHKKRDRGSVIGDQGSGIGDR